MSVAGPEAGEVPDGGLVPAIDGSTPIYTLLAHPTAHVRAPQLFNEICARAGARLVTIPVDVEPARLGAVVVALRSWRNLAGSGVTVPHKEAIAPLLDRLMPQAQRVGAVNVVRREPDGSLTGEAFDGLGFVAALRADGHAPRGWSALLVGAGGTARAIAFALAGAGVRRITVANRTTERAACLVADLAAAHPQLDARIGPPDPAGHQLAVNATKLGMGADDPLPLDAEQLEPGCVVGEVVMSPPLTPLLIAARARGCRVQPGARMLEEQARLNLAFVGVHL